MRQQTRIACYAFTAQGVTLARILATAYNGHVYMPARLLTTNELYPRNQEAREKEVGEKTVTEEGFNSLSVLMARTFSAYTAHIFVGATGIAVRAIAPHIQHKSCDPAVIVCDEKGTFVISLLSGHVGGGNSLANDIALHTQGTAIITTATDIHSLPAIDMLAKTVGCTLIDWDKVKHINAAFLQKEKVLLHDPTGIFTHTIKKQGLEKYFESIDLTVCNTPTMPLHRPTVCVDWRDMPAYPHVLRLAVPIVHIGIGCKKGVSSADILQAITESLATAPTGAINPLAIASLASIDAKAKETGLITAAHKLDVPLRFFTAKALSGICVPNPSKAAAQRFGVDNISVCEGAALLAAGEKQATLLMPKVKYCRHITLAITLALH